MERGKSTLGSGHDIPLGDCAIVRFGTLRKGSDYFGKLRIEHRTIEAQSVYMKGQAYGRFWIHFFESLQLPTFGYIYLLRGFSHTARKNAEGRS
jgi:hypothetical protein